MAWSEQLARFAALLSRLQKSLSADDEYKAETPVTVSDLNAQDTVYYAGDANTGAKTISINLPNDEEVQLAGGPGSTPTLPERRRGGGVEGGRSHPSPGPCGGPAKRGPTGYAGLTTVAWLKPALRTPPKR